MNDAEVINPFVYLQRNAEANPSGVFVETATQKVLNSEAFELAKKIAYEFRHLGVKPGDLVALDLPETLSMIFAEAAFHEAAVSTVLPHGYVADGLFAIDWIFSSATPAPAAHGGARVISVDAAFLQRVEQNPYGITPRDFDSELSTARLVFSSGTTGRANAMEYSLGMLEYCTDAAADTWLAGDPCLTLFPTATPFGFFAFYLSVKIGKPYWSVEAGDPANIIEIALRSSATALRASPAQLAGLVDVLEARNQTLPAVREALTVGSVMPPALSARVRAATDGCVIQNLYGSTEGTVARLRLTDSDDPFDGGQPHPRSDVQIVDENHVEVPDGQIGRIRHKSAYMIQEYVGNPAATLEAFTDGWFYPGDLGLIRPDGGLTLTGRVSEVLNAGGVKVDPATLDLFAVTHPLVSDAASFEYESNTGLKQIGIVLVTEDGLDVQALIRDFGTQFGGAAPKLVARIDEIPRNTMGKPMRRALAEQYKQS
ncbi:class I adenylate-forming enzyme family protein [Microterricola viridarii]|uniref:class I adenylate-forming enzyme family protein n=1 Tax=Microterricola viridarii TaxID=412690 RepID=UPI001560BDC4|nr:fatty acid--CoA ligase family protein [Microterricola viridarii]